jgi:uncharacterized membrane protein
VQRLSLSVLEAIWLAVTLFFVAFVPALGLLLAVLGAMHAYYEDRKVMLIAYCALAGLALALELRAL